MWGLFLELPKQPNYMVQVAESLLQTVVLTPGVFGVKVVVPVIAVTAAVGAVQALACGMTAVMLDMFADTAEFM